MKTKRIYYDNAYISSFTASVLSCVPDGGRFRVVLDQTAFYPEGGGQPCDLGTLGGANVLDVQKADGEIVHFTDAAVSGEVAGEIDFDARYRRMQNHTGEHIASGFFHRLFGAENVGFHMGSEDVTMDFDVELDDYDICRVEALVNGAVYANVPVTTAFPTAAELAATEYRSKLDFPEGAEVRLVTVEGYDVCACSATHVARTGEVGLVKFLSWEKNKGGTRIHMLAGRDAFEDYVRVHAMVTETAQKYSVKPTELPDVLARMDERLAKVKEERRELVRALAGEYVRRAASGAGAADGAGADGVFVTSILGESAAVFFAPLFTNEEMRYLANEAAKDFGYALVFSGDDEAGYLFVMISRELDCREAVKELRSRLALSGGGKADMVSGKAKETLERIMGL